MTNLTFIAGGSKGLGAELLKTFKNQDHQVFEFSRSGKSNHHIECDFNQTNSAEKVFDQSFQSMSDAKLQNINLIINTATLAPFGSLANTDTKTIQQHLTINIESTVLLLRSFISNFQNHPAHKTITYITSGAARRAIPGLAMYSASKAFFERLIDTFAEEQKSQQHRINCMLINPGVMDTGMQVEIRAQDADDFPMVDMWQELHEKGQLADPKDIASICYQLIDKDGENGGYYTAQDYLASDE